VSGERGEHGLLRFEIAKHRIAEHGVELARVANQNRARLRPGRIEIDQSFGLRHRQRPQQKGLEQREHRRRGADSHCQHHSDQGRHSGSSDDLPQRVRDVVH
jgi:hypothetical protein